MTTKPDKTKRSDTSANVALCQEVWRQANTSPTGIRIPCGTTAEAARMRTSLYNAMRNVKQRPADYPTLSDAALNCEIVPDTEDKTVLIVRRKELSPRMLALRQILQNQGVELPPTVLSGTPETREAQASIERLQARIAAEAPVEPTANPTPFEDQAHNLNPFFSRGKQ